MPWSETASGSALLAACSSKTRPRIACRRTYASSHQQGLWTPERLPIFLPDLQRSKHIDRKTSRHLSLGFLPHDLFVQNERHGF